MELLDIRNPDGSPTGQVKERSLVHRDGDLHGTVHIFIVRKNEEDLVGKTEEHIAGKNGEADDGKTEEHIAGKNGEASVGKKREVSVGKKREADVEKKREASGSNYEILLQKRSRNKDSFPGCYDISSAGHLSAGQDYMEAALREIGEELGIRAREQDLRFIGYHEGVAEEVFYGKPFRNHEISAVYLYEEKVDIRELVLQEEEVESVAWFPLTWCLEKAAAGDKGYCLFEDEMEMIRCALEEEPAGK